MIKDLIILDVLIAEIPIVANKRILTLSGEPAQAWKVFVKYAWHVLINIYLPTPAPPVIMNLLDLKRYVLQNCCFVLSLA